MNDLVVPFAKDEHGQLQPPEAAEKGKPYFCPHCNVPLIFKCGEIKVAHFAHKVSANCNQETIIHKIAKMLVQRAVADWKAGKRETPFFKMKCQTPNCENYNHERLPDEVEIAVLEYRLADGSIADVALLSAGKPIMAVEIRVAHAVDENKANRLTIPFFELDGYALVEKPNDWVAIAHNLLPCTCDKCAAEAARNAKWAAEWEVNRIAREAKRKAEEDRIAALAAAALAAEEEEREANRIAREAERKAEEDRIAALAAAADGARLDGARLDRRAGLKVTEASLNAVRIELTVEAERRAAESSIERAAAMARAATATTVRTEQNLALAAARADRRKYWDEWMVAWDEGLEPTVVLNGFCMCMGCKRIVKRYCCFEFSNKVERLYFIQCPSCKAERDEMRWA